MPERRRQLPGDDAPATGRRGAAPTAGCGGAGGGSPRPPRVGSTSRRGRPRRRRRTATGAVDDGAGLDDGSSLRPPGTGRPRWTPTVRPSTPTGTSPTSVMRCSTRSPADVVEVARREVQRGAVVPEGDAARLPSEAHGVLGAGQLGEQQVEDVAALARREIDDLGRERRVDVQHPLAALGVHPHDGVDRRQRLVADPVGDPLVRRARRCAWRRTGARRAGRR